MTEFVLITTGSHHFLVQLKLVKTNCLVSLSLLLSCAQSSSGECDVEDRTFTFVGSVGVVTAVDNEAVIPQVWVTFNNNRTSYQFSQQDVVLETNTKSMYGASIVTNNILNLSIGSDY